jgi:hypothetical protein
MTFSSFTDAELVDIAERITLESRVSTLLVSELSKRLDSRIEHSNRLEEKLAEIKWLSDDENE